MSSNLMNTKEIDITIYKKVRGTVVDEFREIMWSQMAGTLQVIIRTLTLNEMVF